jgi:hypothetical protein
MQVKWDDHTFSSKNCMETKVHSAKTKKSGHHFIYLEDYVIQRQMNKQSGFLAGNVGFSNVKKMVESTDTCVSARHAADMSADMLADMLATRPKIVLAEVLTMSSRHVVYGYVGNMSAYDGNMLAACNQVEHV